MSDNKTTNDYNWKTILFVFLIISRGSTSQSSLLFIFIGKNYATNEKQIKLGYYYFCLLCFQYFSLFVLIVFLFCFTYVNLVRRTKRETGRHWIVIDVDIKTNSFSLLGNQRKMRRTCFLESYLWLLFAFIITARVVKRRKAVLTWFTD